MIILMIIPDNTHDNSDNKVEDENVELTQEF